jgi:hypothetical protein
VEEGEELLSLTGECVWRVGAGLGLQGCAVAWHALSWCAMLCASTATLCTLC